MTLLGAMRFLILTMITGLYGWFCIKSNSFIEIPLDIWAVGLLCAGSQAVELLKQIRKEVK